MEIHLTVLHKHSDKYSKNPGLKKYYKFLFFFKITSFNNLKNFKVTLNTLSLIFNVLGQNVTTVF